MVKRNVWHIIHCGLRFGEMGCECFQFMLSIVFKIRYQAFFWHKYERMHQKLCIQTKLFMTLKISHHILQTEIIQKCCLRAQVFFFFFFSYKSASNSYFIISLNVNILLNLPLHSSEIMFSAKQWVGGKAFAFS